MSASTGSLSSNILFIRLELEQVQPGNRVIRTVYRSVQNIDHHLAGGADHCPVQMSAEHLTLVVPGAHVQVGVKFTVHGVDGAGQRNDLKAAAEGVGVVFLLRSVYHTELHCKEETVRTSISPLPGFGGQNCGQNQMRPAYKQKNPTISNVKSLDLWSEWRESNSRPLEPHCASLENTMYNPILPRLSIVKFQMHYTILYARFSRSTAKISNRTERPCRFLMLYWP